MTAVSSMADSPGGGSAPLYNWPYLLQLIVLAIVDVFGIWLAINIANDGGTFFAAAIGLTIIVITIITVVPGLRPVRWMTPALGLLILLALYPLIYTVYIAFTNFGDGHRFTKREAAELLARRSFLPEGQVNYTWEPFQNEAGDYALYLTDTEGAVFWARPGESIEEIENPGEDVPLDYNGYHLLTGGARFQALQRIQDIVFGDEEAPIGIQNLSEAGAFQQRWVYDQETELLTDLQDGLVYAADDEIGEFVAFDVETGRPVLDDRGSPVVAPIGYWVFVGFRNFDTIFNSSISQGPLLRVFLWTCGFALVGSSTAFAMGLLLALLLDGNSLHLRIIRTLFIIPYAVPGMIGILIWRGMLNINVGVITTIMNDLFGWAPPFSTDPFWAKFSILLVNLWFAAPYFMLIASGALQSISSSVYEAAQVDGATEWVKFWRITLPLVLVALGPLLIASIIFNFNNFLLIEALFEGGPPMPGTSAPPVGHTDNLITYTFRLAFGSSGQRDFGIASALGVLIFMMVGVLTLFQFRLTGTWEEVSENV